MKFATETQAQEFRLNCISHILSHIPYKDVVPAPVQLPDMEDIPCLRTPFEEQNIVPLVY